MILIAAIMYGLYVAAIIIYHAILVTFIRNDIIRNINKSTKSLAELCDDWPDLVVGIPGFILGLELVLREGGGGEGLHSLQTSCYTALMFHSV